MLDREHLESVFREAIRDAKLNPHGQRISPRSVASRAHAIYCAGLGPGEKKPALMTFCMFVAGKSALPEIVELLESEGIRPTARIRLDRRKLRAVFEEAVRRLESRLMKGRARPLQIARRAYELYTRDDAAKPSRLTFQRLIYGKNADPEIYALLREAFEKTRKAGPHE